MFDLDANRQGEFCAVSGWFHLQSTSDDCFLNLWALVVRWLEFTFALCAFASPIYAIVILWFVGKRVRRWWKVRRPNATNGTA
jgi:hypothetical protein